MAGPRLSIRIDLASGDRIGPGKIALLEAIRSTGSISAGARLLGMSYRRCWRQRSWSVGISNRAKLNSPICRLRYEACRRSAG